MDGEKEKRAEDGSTERSVRRNEEELRVETREREAGAMRVRKNVHTERESVPVSKRREEVEVERVPVGREAAEGEGIGEDDEEVVIQVFEEEIVVSKRVVLKEEIRIKKKVVEEVETVEADLRKEEIEIVDETEHATREPEEGG